MIKRDNVETEIECPGVPNFIRVDGVMRPLSFLSEEDLTFLAEEWSLKLHYRRQAQIDRKEADKAEHN
jgi:hypothetical protein